MQENAQLECLSFHLDDEGEKVVATFVSSEDTDNITVNDFKRKVDAAGYGEYLLDEPALLEAVSKYSIGESFEIAVGEAIDGEFDIRIETNQLNAYLTYILPQGGKPMTLDRVLEEARQKKIVHGIDEAAIENVLKEGGENILIASGRPAVDGIDGKFENLVPGAKERCPKLDEHGRADFRELGGIIVVNSGDSIMRRILSTKGEDGLSLLGQIIPAKPGEDVTYSPALAGVKFDPSDQNALLASIDGFPHVLKDGMSVEPIYSANDVDLRVGNIDFLGTVNVTGDVQAGMTIKASGDIHINNTIEGVVLIAGGNIVINGGIIGHTQRDKVFRSSINCTGSCNANFVQNAHILAGDGIFIRDFAMQSELSAKHEIIVGDKNSSKGHIIGGVTRAGMLVKAQVIGSPARLKTVIIAGVDQALHDRLSVISEAFKVASEKLLKVSKLLQMAEVNPGRIPENTIKAAEATRTAINAEIASILAGKKAVEQEIQAGEEAQVVAAKSFLSGTEIYFGSQRQNFVIDRSGGVFRLKDGQLVYI